MRAVGAVGLLMGCALAAAPTASAAQGGLPGLVPTFDVTVRAPDGAGHPVRISHFTPRLAAAEALTPSAIGVGEDAHEVLTLGARWDEVIESALGFDASLSLSGAVALHDQTGATQGIALGATISTLGVDLSGRYAQRDGAADDTLSFGASVATGAWTLGGAVSLGLESAAAAGQPGASVEASYALTRGLRVGGVVAFGDGQEAGAAAQDKAAVAAGMSLRLDF